MGELRDKASRYADEFDGASPLADIEGRARKAAKIRSVLVAENALGKVSQRIVDRNHVQRLVNSGFGLAFLRRSFATRDDL